MSRQGERTQGQVSEAPIASNRDAPAGGMQDVRVRRFPYPFQAMLAISSDIDRTTIESFREIHRFLNTLEETSMGRGVGLDISDSVWVFIGKRAADMSLLKEFDRRSPQPYADELAAYGRVGWIDTLHTYGNYTTEEDEHLFERSHAEIALTELEARGLHLSVWVNHGSATNSQNFGRLPQQQGDLPGSKAYHTDLLLDYGVRFAWDHRRSHMVSSEDPISVLELRDGRRLWGFWRYTHTVGAPASEAFASHSGFFAEWPELRRQLPDGTPSTMVWWPELLDSQLSVARLDQLVADGHYCVAAQHLGDFKGRTGFSPAAIETFRRLREYQDEGRILVARTSRLLEYSRVSQHLRFETRGNSGQLYIDITAVADPVLGTFVPTFEQLRGITFYVPEPDATHLLLAGAPIRNSELVRSPNDGTDPSIGVRWFEPDTTDYVALHEGGRIAPDRSPSPTKAFTQLDPFPVEELDETSVAVDPSDLGLEPSSRLRYSATPRNVIQLVLEGVEINPDDVFLHLGSGKGRMLLVAASHPFRRVIGIEIAEPLSQVARRNLEHNADRLACRNVEVITADPADWPIPDDVTTVFFFDSFRGESLDQALANIVASLDRQPRRLTFISLYPVDAQAVEATGRFERVRTVQFGEKPLEQIAYYEAKTDDSGTASSVSEPPVIDWLLAERDNAPRGLPPAAFTEAVDYAVGRFSAGLRHYELVVERIGLTGGKRALDVGSGAGHWCVAMARTNDEIVGIEMRPEFVEVARLVVDRLGIGDRVSFVAETAEGADLPAASFDRVCCHSVLMYVDYGPALHNIARWTAPGGLFYCGYSTLGIRVREVITGLAEASRSRIEHGLQVLLATARWHAAMGGRQSVLALSKHDVLRTCDLLGFEFVESPGVQDAATPFLGFPVTFDCVCRRRASDARDALLSEGVAATAWTETIEALVDAGLPRLALETIASAPTGVPTVQLAALRFRAMLRLGQPVEVDEDLDPTARALLQGMSHHVAGRVEHALGMYESLPEDHPRRATLMALALYDLRRYEEASAIASGAEHVDEGVFAFALAIAAALAANDMESGRVAAAEFVSQRVAAGLATPDEADPLLESLKSARA